MKKVLVVIAIFIAMVLMVGCGGGSSSGDRIMSASDSMLGESCNYPGMYLCSDDSFLLICDYYELIWLKVRECYEGEICNARTGTCDNYDNYDNNDYNNSGSNSAECLDVEYQCSGDYSYYYCYGEYEYEYCPYGCNRSTGRCKSSSGGSNGGNSGGNNSGGSGSGGDSGSGSGSGGGSSSECYSGEYSCTGSSSYYCSGGYWTYDEYCSNGCDYSTGRCNSSSGGGSTSECSYGDYKCENGDSYKCSAGTWKLNKTCDQYCDYSTGQCGNLQECYSGDYKCSGSDLYKCSNGSWKLDKYCPNGCDSLYGECKSSSAGKKLCIDDFNGEFTGTSSTYLNVHWSLTTSGNCGKPDSITLEIEDPVTASWVTLAKRNYYDISFIKYEFDAEHYLESINTVYLSLVLENQSALSYWTIGCDYKEDHWGDYNACYTISHN